MLMRKGSIGFGVAMMGAMVLATPAAAENVVADPTQLMDVMRTAGYKVELKTADTDTYIRASRGKDGYKFSILFYGCEEKTTRDCKSVQFFAAFTPKTKPTLEALNTYSTSHRWGRFYIDKDNDAVIEMDVDMEQGGMSQALYIDNLEYFETVMNRYAEFVFKEK